MQIFYLCFSFIYVSSLAGVLTLHNSITLHGAKKTQSSLICILNHVLLLQIILCL